MARIQTYNLDPTITLEDKVIGSNFIGTTNDVKKFETANYTMGALKDFIGTGTGCLLYTSPSPRDATLSRMPSSA